MSFRPSSPATRPLLSHHYFLYQLADDVAYQYMRLLYAWGVSAGYVKQVIAAIFHFAAGRAREGDDSHTALLGFYLGEDDILRVAGGGDTEKHITFPALCLYSTLVYLVV